MDPNVVLPLASSLLSLVFFVFLADQWRERRRTYQLIWAAGMLWYGLSAGTEFLGGALGWSEPLYRAWYLMGAVWVAGWLGLGTMYLLARTRFGYAAAFSVLLAGLFTFLSWRRYDYPDSGISPYLYAGIAVAVAIAIAIQTYRTTGGWARLAGLLIVGGSIVSIPLVLFAPLAAPGYAVDAATGIPSGELFPGYVRLLTPLFNVTGGFALVLGALFSVYVFIDKARLIHYSLERGQPPGRFVRSVLTAAVGVPVNFLASLPGAFRALLRGDLDRRVPGTILIALGGLVPSITGGLSRFGSTSGFFLGELVGVVLIFSGFLWIEAVRELRIPFTHIVLHARRSGG